MGLNLKSIKGDTFDEVNFSIKKNDVAIDLTGAIIRMQLRQVYGGVIFLNLTSVANAGITITNAAGGLFKINEQVIDIPAFNYIFDIEFIYDDLVKTYISGNFIITNDVTR